MISSKIKNLIVKYLIGEASSDDMDFLASWIEQKENQKIFDNFVKIHFEVTTAMKKPDIESIKKNLLIKMKRDKNPFYNGNIRHVFKYAAVFMLIFSLGYVFKELSFQQQTQVAQKNLLIPNKLEEVTVQLENGQIKQLDADGVKEIRDSNGNVISTQSKSKLTYHSAEYEGHLVYNKLVVPNGKRFDLVLSDGSHVYLNSGSTIKFPVHFLKEGNRDVFLTGEAFFDVAKNERNPFIVHADKFNIKVLGTKFNVNHRSENIDINTVLVEGSVELYGDEDLEKTGKIILKPGYKAAWGKSNKSIVTESVDTRIFTSWIDGKLIFRNATFKSIRYALERFYNVTIKNQNALLDEQRFDATFDIETINEVFETFSKSYAIKYEVVNNMVIIQ